MNPNNTVFDAKRLIGRDFTDNTVQRDMKHWPFTVVEAGKKPKIQVEFKCEQKTFTPEEISSMVRLFLTVFFEFQNSPLICGNLIQKKRIIVCF